METGRTKFANFLLEKMLKAGYSTQKAQAELLGYSESVYSRLLSKRTKHLASAAATNISQKIGIDMSELTRFMVSTDALPDNPNLMPIIRLIGKCVDASKIDFFSFSDLQQLLEVDTALNGNINETIVQGFLEISRRRLSKPNESGQS